MKLKRKIALVMMLATAQVSAVFAMDQTVAEQRLAAFESQFIQTGKSQRCIPLRNIYQTHVIDNQHILFRVSANSFYVNKLPRQCNALSPHRGFSYNTSMTRLCSVDSITPLDIGPPRIRRFGRSFEVIGPRCGLGRFEKVERKPVKELPAASVEETA